MEQPLIASSARKHGVSDTDMLHAFNNPILTEDLDDGFTMLIGPSETANLLEIEIIESPDGPIIIHTMPARRKYLR